MNDLPSRKMSSDSFIGRAMESAIGAPPDELSIAPQRAGQSGRQETVGMAGIGGIAVSGTGLLARIRSIRAPAERRAERRLLRRHQLVALSPIEKADFINSRCTTRRRRGQSEKRKTRSPSFCTGNPIEALAQFPCYRECSVT